MAESADVTVSPMPRPPSNAVQVALRVPADWLPRADRLIASVSAAGVSATRTDVLRAAIARGLDELEAEGARRQAAEQREAARATEDFYATMGKVQAVIKLSGLNVKILGVDDKTGRVTVANGRDKLVLDIVDAEGVIASMEGSKIAGFDPDTLEPVLRGSARDKQLKRDLPWWGS